MYQNHVKLFVEMALPEATEEMLNYAYWQGAKEQHSRNKRLQHLFI